jgi:hypothetical protein
MSSIQEQYAETIRTSQMLEVQREFAKNLASTAAAAGEATRQQAEARRRRCKTRPSSPGRRVSEALRRRPPTPT